MIILKYDAAIDIATARSRNAANWKNKQMNWSEIVNKLSATHRTVETYAEYMREKKPRQDEIKDVGGFVGGYLTNGKRRKGHVLHRQLVCLDIDYAKNDIWTDFEMIYDCAGAIYTTHKHSAESPRYRLVIPLDRPVFTEEYSAIGRRIAGNLGIENFDNSTFQPERLMYWPSTSKDGEFVSAYQDGPFLSADTLLKSYRNWQDFSEWPISDRFAHAVSSSMKKQGDPLEKLGIIGAFCRAYSIEEAINLFLQDCYERCDVENRYTFKGGSTSGGLVVYDDKFAYSHHGTDPASGKLCNAFDLVRLHLFGLKDEDTDIDTPVNKKPSFVSMTEFAMKQGTVRKLVGSERIAAAIEDFNEFFEEPETDPEEIEKTSVQVSDTTNDDWLTEMQVTRSGAFLSTINNIVLILNNDPKLKGCFAYDAFELREVALRNLPWRSVKESKYLKNTDDSNLRRYLEKVYGISGLSKIQDAVDIVCSANAFHPVRDYLNAQQWDGKARVDKMLINYLGAEDNDYTRAVARKMMCAAVARVFEPGVKFDQICVLVGPQGLKKSMFIDKIGMQWYSDSIYTLQGKEAFEALQGVWLCEMAELSAMKNNEVEQTKHFVSKRADRYRVAFGKRLENFLRQCIFWATTNKWNFLKDDKNRRFWPVPVHVIKPKFDTAKITKTEVGQLWAESVVLYKAGEPLYLENELLKIAEEIQENHKQVDDRVGLIRSYLEMKLPEDWEKMNNYERRNFLQDDELNKTGTVIRQKFCVISIWAELFGGQIRDFNKRNACELHDIAESLKDWTREEGKSRYGIYGIQRGYVKIRKDTLKFTAGSSEDFSDEKSLSIN